jgi:hypothetical protein
MNQAERDAAMDHLEACRERLSDERDLLTRAAEAYCYNGSEEHALIELAKSVDNLRRDEWSILREFPEYSGLALDEHLGVKPGTSTNGSGP